MRSQLGDIQTAHMCIESTLYLQYNHECLKTVILNFKVN